ncbi:MAG: class I SAM-dependent methyltransferase, partial [Alphaproteobacteria bacterium]|nr:class I SAM-dependent methyltransferase [Alphaproteobacteria bacterium]
TATGLVDLGSGAGFPGLVLAIMGARGVELIESNARKSVFLAEAARATGTELTVTHGRIEKIAPRAAAVVTARACAPLGRLLGHISRHLAPGGRALLLKGAGVDAELTAAAKDWTMALDRLASVSDAAGVILEIRDLGRAHRS